LFFEKVFWDLQDFFYLNFSTIFKESIIYLLYFSKKYFLFV